MENPGGIKKFPFLHLALFFFTLLTTLIMGALYAGADILSEPYKIYKGIPFTFGLMVILMSHELSHYFTSRSHGVEATLPYFIPAPPILSPIGTFGAFIKMKSPIITRKALIDIGASGPIVGFIFSVIVAVVGLHMSHVVLITQSDMGLKVGDSLLFTFLKTTILGDVPPGHDILLHPVAFAGWIGLFVTAMNLIPVGQLDGGHIAYALFGEKQIKLSFSLVALMTVLGTFFWVGWFVWAGLLLILGLRHPPVIHWEVPLDRKRRVVGWIALVIFILTFIPMPFEIKLR